jgi:transposase InsO family protein
MEELLDIYYNPKTGFISAQKLYLKLGKRISLKTINTFLKQQEVYQQMTERKRKIRYRPIQVYSSNNQWQVDLIDFSKFSHWNGGYKYLLCSVDVFSRKALVIPMKHKSDSTESMKTILFNEKPIVIQSDNGTEFVNRQFQRLLKKHNITHITVQTGDHNRQSIIERFNRSIEAIISKYQLSRNTNKYIDILDDIVYNYNHTYHRGINDIPEITHLKSSSTGKIKNGFIDTGLKVGDKVRMIEVKSVFRKGYETKNSKNIYTIVSGNGYSYSLKNKDNDILKRTYKYYELIKVEQVQPYSITEVVREKPQTLKQKRNQKEIDELNRIRAPLQKKRRIESPHNSKRKLVDGEESVNKRRRI